MEIVHNKNIIPSIKTEHPEYTKTPAGEKRSVRRVGRSPKWLNTRPRKAKYIQDANFFCINYYEQ